MTNRCRLCPQNPLPVSLLAATDPQGRPSLDALFMGYGMFYSLHPPWIASTAKCSGSRGSLQTQDTCSFVSQSGRETGWGQNLDRPPLCCSSTRPDSPALWFWQDRTPLTYSCLEGRLNRSSSLQTKLWTFSSICVECLWRSKCLQHDIAYYSFMNYIWQLDSYRAFQLPITQQLCHSSCAARAISVLPSPLLTTLVTKHVCVPDMERSQTNSNVKSLDQRFIAGPCKEAGGSCLKKPWTPPRVSSKLS